MRQVLSASIPDIVRKSISDAGSFSIPSLYFRSDQYKIFPDKSILVTNVETRKVFAPERPIIVIRSPQLENELFIEILIDRRHTFEKMDYAYLRNNRIYCIELDARSIYKTKTHDDDEIGLLVRSTELKFWIYNPDLTSIEAYLKQKYSKAKPVANLQVRSCPITSREEWKFQRSSASVGECKKCRFCVLKEEIDLNAEVNCVGDQHSNFAKLIEEAREALFPGQLQLF